MPAPSPPSPTTVSPRYKWIAQSNTTLGVLMATINSSIMLIALPDIFRGIGINPLQPGNTTILLWMIMGFLVVTAVLVVSFGRLGDMFGRVRMFNMGFAIFAVFSILLSVTWLHGEAAGWYLIVMRIFQGVGGTIWSYLKLKELGVRKPAKLDLGGNLTFAAGLIAVLVGITYGIQPYGTHTMGWTSPLVITLIGGGLVVLAIFCYIETKVPEPMFSLRLFRIRAFTFGNLASLLSSLGRGGLMFILIIWLQGIYLPLHGYSFENTPLWAGLAMIPLTLGFLIAGPVSGILSDRFGARPFATGGMLLAALSFGLLELLPVNFTYWQFAVILLLNGIGMGLFASPNRAGIMNALPADKRGVGAGMSATFQNSAMELSIGIFFSLIILGLSASLPSHLFAGLTAQGVPAAAASGVSHLPPTAIMFAALLGYNPIQMLLGSTLSKLPASPAAYLTGHSFFPSLIAAPFQSGLDIAFDFAIAACLIAAVASLLRGKRYVHELHSEAAVAARATQDAESALETAAEAPAALRVEVAEDLEASLERTAAPPAPAMRHRKQR